MKVSSKYGDKAKKVESNSSLRGTQQTHNVETTSLQRRYVAATL